MGNKISNMQVSFDDIQRLIQDKDTLDFEYYLIHTLPESEQSCLLLTTLDSHEEIIKLNESLSGDVNPKRQKKNIKIIIYGRNSSDPSVFSKYKQLHSLGFPHVYIYPGGLFEWLLLQDIYGQDLFPTGGQPCIDFLKYKPPSLFKT